MTYCAPVSDMLSTMKLVTNLVGDEVTSAGEAADSDLESADTILSAAAQFAEAELAPLNRVGDIEGARLDNGAVTTASGWRSCYAKWRASGWNQLTPDPEVGGLGLPNLLNSACIEMWNAANLAFALCPLLTMGAVEALAAHASPALKAVYLGKLVSGEWTATMNLTEPQAGSDLNGLRSRALRQTDGSYRIFGSKCFITYGEHDLTDNIIHLVLARLADAPPGTRGISLFLVPKFLVQADGSLGPRNDVRCTGIEHKLGIHASPTCSMAFGDAGGAVGYLIGEENRGLACMFTMMNNARLGVGLQGVAIADRAYQQALTYAKDRRQGAAAGAASGRMSPIIAHPDVRRMLLTMQALTQACRAICYLTAAALDRARRGRTQIVRQLAHERASLLTPVAKAFSTDIGSEVASLGVQIHGGMGFIEETGAAQYLRDARIASIYEGTNGIQAIDLVLRKLPMTEGDAMRRELAQMRTTLTALDAANSPAFGMMAVRLREAHASLERATNFIRASVESATERALAGASPFLRLFGLVRGGTALAELALAAQREIVSGQSDPNLYRRIASARFFAENIVPIAAGLASSVVEGYGSITEAADALGS
jgi:butyryl-CoA dehydrogenase